MINTSAWAKIVNQIEKERGQLTMCAVVLRDESPDRWDVVVAAPWLNPSKRESYEYLAKTFSQFLTREEMLSISRIVPVSSNDPLVKEFTLHAPNLGPGSWASGGPLGKFMGMNVVEAYLFVDRRPF